MKRKFKSLILLPLLALCLTSCDDIIAELGQLDDQEDLSSDSYEDSEEPEIEDETESETESDTGSEPKEDVITYSLEITNKSEFEAGITNSYDNPNTYNYSLNVSLYTYTNGDITSTTSLDSDSLISTSSNPSIVDVSGTSLILGTVSGEVTISTSYKEDTTLCDSVTFIYTYTEHQQDLSYSYDLEITNKEALGSTWLTSDSPRTIELKLTKYTYDGTTLIDTDDTVNAEGNVVITTQNIVSDYENVVTIDGFDVTPAHPGSVALVATWTDTGVYDTTEVIVEEDYIDGNYSITVNSEAITTGDWYYGDSGRTLSGLLSYTTTAYSDSTKVETHTIELTSSNVDIQIKDKEGNTSIVLTNDGLTLIPTGQGEAVVYISWIDNGAILASTSFEVTILEPIAPVYKLEILNKTALQQAWYLGDAARELEISITPDSDTAVEQNVESLISNDEIQVCVDPSDSLDVSTSGGKIYLSPLKASESITVSVSWTDHSEAIDSLTLSLGEHSYAISITNSESLSSAWSVNEGVRTLTYELYQDGSLLSNETGYVVLYSSDEELASVDGFSIYPKADGEPIIYILWYENEDQDNLLAYDLVALSINTNVAATGVTLSKETIVFANILEEYEMSATVYGLNNERATNQAVTWSIPTGFTLNETEDDNTVIIKASQYNASGTIVCTSEDGGYTAECSVSIGDTPAIPTPDIGVDTTYKLGADAGSNNYCFFNGELTEGSSTYLAITNDWRKAADVYITAIPYDGIDNSCTLSFVDANGTLQYLNNDNSNNTVTLSTSPVTWVYNETNSVFAVTSSSGHALFLYSGSSIRCYQQNTTNLNNPHIAAYATQPEGYEDPADYTIVEPQVGDATYVLGCIDSSGTYHYFNGSTTGTTFLGTTTEWDSAAAVYVTPVEGLEEVYTLAIASGGSFKYITATGSTSVTLETVTSGNEPCLWYWNDETQVYAINSSEGRALFYYESNPSFRSYAQSDTYLAYPHVVTYAENPNNLAPSSITVSGKDSLYVGGSTQLTAEMNPSYANNSVIWSTSNASIATVDQTGYVEAVGVGSVTITATSALNESVYGYITIEVSEAPSGLTEKLLGTIDMTQNTQNQTNASYTTLTNLLPCWTGDSNDFTSVSSVTNVYLGANSNSNTGNEKVLQVGSSSNTGTFTLGFSENVTKVVVYGAGYVDSSARGLTIGGSSQSFSNYISASNIGNDSSWNSYAQTLEFELDGNSQSVTIANTGKRVVLRTIDIYYLG